MIKHFMWGHIICREVINLGGAVYMSTPHSSILNIGLFNPNSGRTELTIEDRKKAIKYIVDARKKGIYKSNNELIKRCEVHYREKLTLNKMTGE